MQKIGYISTFQMFSVLFLSRIISLLTFMLPSASYLPAGDRIITTVPVMLIEFVYTIVLIYTHKQDKNKNLIERTKDISETPAKILALTYCAAFIWFAGIGTARFELFISTVMFPNSELTLMIILLLGACFYASLKGIEAIGRAATLLLAVLGASVVFILISVAKEFEYSNLLPVFTEGLSPVLNFSFYVSVRAAEIMTLHISAPFIKGNVKKMLFLWIFSFAVMCLILLLFLSGVTGKYGDDQIFPLYTLTVIAKFGIFERLDDILTGIWVLCSFIQVSYLLFLCVFCVRQGFGRVKKIPAAAICTAGVFTVYIATSRTVTLFSETVSSRILDIFFITLTVIIPLSVTIILKFRKKERTKI